MPQHLTTTGPAPVRLGGEMLGVAEGSPIEVDAEVSNLGESLLVDATVHGRCLAELDEPLSVRISDVFGINADFITRDGVAGGETGDDDDFEPLLVQDDMVDITQLVLDEVGLNLPFNPVCEDYGHECADDIPAPDGISEEQEPAPDARWAGLAGKLDEIADEADSDDSEDGKN